MPKTFTKNSGIREYVYVMSFQTGFVQSVQVFGNMFACYFMFHA